MQTSYYTTYLGTFLNKNQSSMFFVLQLKPDQEMSGMPNVIDGVLTGENRGRQVR